MTDSVYRLALSDTVAISIYEFQSFYYVRITNGYDTIVVNLDEWAYICYPFIVPQTPRVHVYSEVDGAIAIVKEKKYGRSHSVMRLNKNELDELQKQLNTIDVRISELMRGHPAYIFRKFIMENTMRSGCSNVSTLPAFNEVVQVLVN